MVAPNFFIFVCSTLWLTLEFPQVSEACSTPSWFGPACQYKCQCRLWDKCDTLTGNCTEPDHNGFLCAPGFAGTSCQYENLAYNQLVTADFSILGKFADTVDGKATSCWNSNGNTDQQPITINITRSPWTDVITVLTYGLEESRDELQVEVVSEDGQSSTLDPNRLQVMSDTSSLVTYRLPRPQRVAKVQIRATTDQPFGLCEVSVLGGRNMALKKKAVKMTSSGDLAADEVVDGLNSTCSPADAQGSMWNVPLGVKVNVWRVIVKSDDTAGFHGNVTLTQEGSRPRLVWSDIGDMVLTEPAVASDVSVDLAASAALCAVQAIGDCVDGYYGLNCENRCQCKEGSEICDKIWGHCPADGCKAGFTGNNCSQACPKGTFGQNCSMNCSSACVDDACDHVTGQCIGDCRPGHTSDPACKSCAQGTYGAGCAQVCSQNCVQPGRCHPRDGRCLDGCRNGWHGDMCDQGCERGRYGQDCRQTCSAHCVDGVCDRFDGGCTCKSGVEAPECWSFSSARSSATGHVSLVMTSVAVLITVAAF